LAANKLRYLCSFEIAKNTRSSTGTVGVNIVAFLPSDSASCFANPLNAGPAGFAEFAGVSPGISEMRVVFGVQF
jgi:hypothetical protein